jgi:hypothetical protein
MYSNEIKALNHELVSNHPGVCRAFFVPKDQVLSMPTIKDLMLSGSSDSQLLDRSLIQLRQGAEWLDLVNDFNLLALFSYEDKQSAHGDYTEYKLTIPVPHDDYETKGKVYNTFRGRQFIILLLLKDGSLRCLGSLERGCDLARKFSSGNIKSANRNDITFDWQSSINAFYYINDFFAKEFRKAMVMRIIEMQYNDDNDYTFTSNEKYFGDGIVQVLWKLEQYMGSNTFTTVYETNPIASELTYRKTNIITETEYRLTVRCIESGANPTDSSAQLLFWMGPDGVILKWINVGQDSTINSPSIARVACAPDFSGQYIPSGTPIPLPIMNPQQWIVYGNTINANSPVAPLQLVSGVYEVQWRYPHAAVPSGVLQQIDDNPTNYILSVSKYFLPA